MAVAAARMAPSLAAQARRARGMLSIVRSLASDRRAPFLAREELLARRDARVRETVRFAATEVPYYRELFRAEAIDPREIRGAYDLARLPVLDKERVQEDPELFRPDSPRDSLVPFRTTGSSGMPLTVYHDRRSLLDNIAYSERERAVITQLCGKRLRYLTLAIAPEHTTNSQVQDAYAATSFRPFRPRHAYVDVGEHPEAVVAEINRLRPEVLSGDGSYLEVLVRLVVALDLELRPPKVFQYHGDAITREGRAFIERHTGTPVVSRYAAVEAFKIAFTCEERRYLHLHEDLCHVVVAGSDGRALPPGELGQVVISNLVNRGTVLLNYRLGDTARLFAGSCQCGRTLALLGDLEGRVSEIVRLASGRLVHPLGLWNVLKGREGVIRYQLVQRGLDRFDFRLVVADESAYPALAEAIERDLRELLEGSDVRVVRSNGLELEGGRKFLPVIALREGA